MSAQPGTYARVESWLLLFALAGLAVVTMVGVGSYKPFVHLVTVLVIVHAARVLWRERSVQPMAGWLLLAPVTFVVCDALATDAVSDKRAIQNLVAYVAVAGAVWALPVCWRSAQTIRLGIVMLLTGITLAHSVFLVLYLEPAGPIGNPQLLFDNPHFIALQAVVAAPVLVHAAVKGGGARWIAAAGLCGIAFNLFQLNSIIGGLSLGVAGAVVVTAHLPRNPRRAATAALVALALAVFFYPIAPAGYELPLEWIMDEVGASRPDQRFWLWTDAGALQAGAGMPQWLLGHGLGGFEAEYEKIWVFPHHFFLEVLFNSGLVGLAAFVLSLAALWLALARGVSRRDGGFAVALALLSGIGLFTFLTLPLTARVTMHLAGFGIGFVLWAMSAQAAQTRDEAVPVPQQQAQNGEHARD